MTLNAKLWRRRAIASLATLPILYVLAIANSTWLYVAVFAAALIYGWYQRSQMKAAPLESLIEIGGDVMAIQTSPERIEKVDLSGVEAVQEGDSDQNFLCLVLDCGKNGTYRKYVPFYHPHRQRVAQLANAHVRHRSAGTYSQNPNE